MRDEKRYQNEGTQLEIKTIAKNQGCVDMMAMVKGTRYDVGAGGHREDMYRQGRMATVASGEWKESSNDDLISGSA